MTDTLNATQRATLQAAQSLRLKRAVMQHYQQLERIAQTPDYYQFNEGRQRRDHARRVVRK